MAKQTTSIIFKITNAGKEAALQAGGEMPKVKIELSELAVGSGKYTPNGQEVALKGEVQRSSIVSGDIETASNTLRFSSSMTADTVIPVYELGLFTTEGVLFAIAASSTTPLFTIYPNITFVGAFGLSLNEAAAANITVVTDPNGALAITLMQQHLAAPDPHPQYLNARRFTDFLELAYPYGHPYWTHSKSNPKPLFDAMFGYETHWRRLEGVGLIAVKDGDTYIGQPMLTLGQVGNTEPATTGRPHAYPIYTSYLFERYNPDDVIETVWRVTANKNAINEGSTVSFTVTANNLPDGQILDWSAKEGALNSSSNDITNPDKTGSGTVILRNGQAIIDFTTTPDDNVVEPQKHVRLTVGAPANLSINIPITDAGHNETALHITKSTNEGISLDEYYKQQSGAYPTATDRIRFIVDAGVDIVAPNTSTPAMVEGNNWPVGAQIVVENRGRILGRGGDGGRSAYQFKAWAENGDMIYATSKSVYRTPQKGGNGGTSIKSLTRAIIVENHSVIAGGGGGGGGLGAYRTAGDYNFVVGGGGTGGGAPFGLRSPNETTYTMYLQDPTVTDKKLPMPDDGKFYYALFQRKEGSVANAQGSENDYSYDSSYTAASSDETRAMYVEAVVGQNKRPTGNFKQYRIGGGTGLPHNQTAFNVSQILNMSQDASLNAAGTGGANISPSVASGWAASARVGLYAEGYDPNVNKGGDGGGLGENGQDGVFEDVFYHSGDGEVTKTTTANTTWYIPPAAGGLAGYIKEGSVTITNFGGGTTKGR